MSSRRRRRKKRRARAKGRAVQVLLERVEFAAGHDGFLRGKPEPVLILGAYMIVGDELTLMGRAMFEASVKEPYPSVTQVGGAPLLDLVVNEETSNLCLLCLAVERDGGKDVARAYALLEEPGRLRSWSPDEQIPEPKPLRQLAEGPELPPAGRAVHLLWRDNVLGEDFASDDWVGAAFFVTPIGWRRATKRYRLRFLSRDRRNDWTGVFRLSW